MTDSVLTLNAGSSSLKFAVYGVDDGALGARLRLEGQVSGLDHEPRFSLVSEEGAQEIAVPGGAAAGHQGAYDLVFDAIDARLGDAPLLAVGHRVVHGGATFSAPARLSPATIAALDALSPLAPGHQPHNLAGVRAAIARWPEAPQVACFDTSFHRTQGRAAELFALPRRFADEGVIRYGFHGLSYEYIAGAAPTVMDRAGPPERMIVAHLGAGASMCAMKDGRSVATTMGFTALDGLPMGTRCGDLDPGVILYFLQEKKMSAYDIADCLYRESGLKGLSGVASDMRALEASDAPEAAEAIAYFVYRCVREIGALAAVLGGVDALVFTAGVGENAARVRADILEGCRWLGFELDENANAAVREGRITNAGAGAGGREGPSAWVIPTNEELMIARRALEAVRLDNAGA